MSMKRRIFATVGAATLVASFGLAAAPAGAGTIGIPDPCHHDCGGGAWDPTPWNDDDLGFTSEQLDPPTEHPTDQPVVADANFTG
jgi:hypothetical protein